MKKNEIISKLEELSDGIDANSLSISSLYSRISKFDFNNDDLKCHYSKGPEWFQDKVSIERKIYKDKVVSLNKLYCEIDPVTNNILVVGGLVFLKEDIDQKEYFDKCVELHSEYKDSLRKLCLELKEKHS